MKLITVVMVCIIMVFMLTGISNSSYNNSHLNITKASVNKLITQPPPTEPVVIQIQHQGFPFDVAGNFPYVVTIDNVVYRYDKKVVSEFLRAAKQPPPWRNTN
jgi:hypothetical protein